MYTFTLTFINCFIRAEDNGIVAVAMVTSGVVVVGGWRVLAVRQAVLIACTGHADDHVGCVWGGEVVRVGSFGVTVNRKQGRIAG